MIFKDHVKINGYLATEEVKCVQKFLMSQLAPEEKDTILEFGCGTGMHLDALSKRCWKIVGVDHLTPMVKKAREFNKENRNVEVIPWAGKRLPFNDNTFNKIYSWNVFQYLNSHHNALEVIEELHRIVKPNGRIFLGDLPFLAMRWKFTEQSMGLPVPIISNIFRRLSCFLYTYYDKFILRSICQKKFGLTKIPKRDSRLPWSAERFDLLIDVKKK